LEGVICGESVSKKLTALQGIFLYIAPTKLLLGPIVRGSVMPPLESEVLKGEKPGAEK